MHNVTEKTPQGKPTYTPAIRPTQHRTLWQIQSFTDPEVWYDIYLSEERTVAKCSCKAFAKDKAKECKHIKMLRAHLVMGNGQPEASHQEENSLSLPPAPEPEERNSDHTPSVKKILQPWIIEIHRKVKGVETVKEAVKVAGLVYLAHRPDITGLTLLSLKVVPVQVTERLAVSQATAIFQDAQGNRLEFSDLADACPGNVSEMVAAHFIRVSATRAIGRCLRWALNVADLVTLEEIEG